MVNYLTSVALLLTVATSALAVPQGLEARAPSCLDNLPGNTLANVHMIQQPFHRYSNRTANPRTDQ